MLTLDSGSHAIKEGAVIILSSKPLPAKSNVTQTLSPPPNPIHLQSTQKGQLPARWTADPLRPSQEEMKAKNKRADTIIPTSGKHFNMDRTGGMVG